MTFLIEGLKPLKTFRDARTIEGKRWIINIVVILVTQFVYYKDWVWTTTEKSPQLSIGGIVTPILKHRGVDLGSEETGIERVDVIYFNKGKFLARRIGDMYAYKFTRPSKELAKIMLPQPSLTLVQVRDNLLFNPSDEFLYNSAIHLPLEPIRKPRKSRHIAGPSHEQNTTNEGGFPSSHLSHIYGSERYYFEPYDEVISNNATQDAHKKIQVLQRWNIWQDKTIRKLVKTVKDLKNKVNGS